MSWHKAFLSTFVYIISPEWNEKIWNIYLSILMKSKLRGFEERCLRGILGIWQEQKVTYKEIAKRTGINCIVEKIKKRHWKRLGHVFWRKKNLHSLLIALIGFHRVKERKSDHRAPGQTDSSFFLFFFLWSVSHLWCFATVWPKPRL